MYIQKIIRDNIQTGLKEIFQFDTNNIELQQTKKEFEGDITLVVFPLIKELLSKLGTQSQVTILQPSLKQMVPRPQICHPKIFYHYLGKI